MTTTPAANDASLPTAAAMIAATAAAGRGDDVFRRQQHVDDLRPTQRCRPVQRRPEHVVHGVDVALVLANERRDDVGVALGDGDVQTRSTLRMTSLSINRSIDGYKDRQTDANKEIHRCTDKERQTQRDSRETDTERVKDSQREAETERDGERSTYRQKKTARQTYSQTET